MSFSLEIVDPTGNSASTASPTLVVSPTTAIITAATMTPGSTATGTVNVSNSSGVDEFFEITANWSPTGATTQSAACRLANELTVSVTVVSPAATVFVGTLAGLLDQPASPGQALAAGVNEDLQFEVALPGDATASYQGIELGFDIIFVALM